MNLDGGRDLELATRDRVALRALLTLLAGQPGAGQPTVGGAARRLLHQVGPDTRRRWSRACLDLVWIVWDLDGTPDTMPPGQPDRGRADRGRT